MELAPLYIPALSLVVVGLLAVPALAVEPDHSAHGLVKVTRSDGSATDGTESAFLTLDIMASLNQVFLTFPWPPPQHPIADTFPQLVSNDYRIIAMGTDCSAWPAALLACAGDVAGGEYVLLYVPPDEEPSFDDTPLSYLFYEETYATNPPTYFGLESVAMTPKT